MDMIVDEEREKMMGDHLPLWRVYISAHDWANALRVCEQALADDSTQESDHALLHITQLLSSLTDSTPDDEGLVAISESLGEENYGGALAHSVRLDPGSLQLNVGRR